MSGLSHLATGMGLEAEVLRALKEDLVIGSVGPVMNTALVDAGLCPDIIPEHPKMAALVRAAAEMSAAILRRKRRIPA